ncbi:MAG: hypothetical protein JOZ52_00355 [Acidobacteria bacterium]|nr:hypothetical protein [Acidobacteriota bacterium]
MSSRLLTLCSLALLCALLLSGCKKDAEINSAMADIHTTTDEVVKKVDAAPNAAGVDAAQQLFDSRKPDLKAKWETIKAARGFQVSEDTKKKMVDSYTTDYAAMKNLEIKHMSVSLQDEAFKSKLEKLVKDWEDTFKIE